MAKLMNSYRPRNMNKVLTETDSCISFFININVITKISKKKQNKETNTYFHNNMTSQKRIISKDIARTHFAVMSDMTTTHDKIFITNDLLCNDKLPFSASINHQLNKSTMKEIKPPNEKSGENSHSSVSSFRRTMNRCKLSDIIIVPHVEKTLIPFLKRNIFKYHNS